MVRRKKDEETEDDGSGKDGADGQPGGDGGTSNPGEAGGGNGGVTIVGAERSVADLGGSAAAGESTPKGGEPGAAAQFSKMVRRDTMDVLRDLDLDSLTAGQRSALIKNLGGEVEESAEKAAIEFQQEREHAARCEVYRQEPEEWEGVSIYGLLRTFRTPFSAPKIKEWIAKVHGGGKYRIVVKHGDGDFGASQNFTVAGNPRIPRDMVEAPDEEEAEKRTQVAASDDRAAILERRLIESNFERQRIEDRARADAQRAEDRAESKAMFERLTTALTSVAESVKQKPESPKTDLAALAAQLAPLALQFLQGQQAAAAAAREAQLAAVNAQVAAQQKQTELLMAMQEKAEARMAKVLEAQNAKKETLTDNLKLMTEMKKAFGGDDPLKVIRETWPAMIKVHMDTMSKIELHKAGVGAEKEETFAERALGSLTDLAEQVLPQILTRQPAGQPVAPYGGIAPTPPAAANLPGPAAPRAGGTIVTPEQQAAHEAAEKAAKTNPAAAAVAPAAQPAAPSAQPAATAAPAAQQAQAEISTETLTLALRYLQEGRSGRELAAYIEEQEEAFGKANNGAMRFFSKRLYGFISSAKPETVLATLLPQLQPHAVLAPLCDAIGQAFLIDFCTFFSEELPDEGGA